MTPFRKSQARAVLEGMVRVLVPQMVGADSLRLAVQELARDAELWAELELQRHPFDVPAQTPAASMETSPLMKHQPTSLEGPPWK